MDFKEPLNNKLLVHTNVQTGLSWAETEKTSSNNGILHIWKKHSLCLNNVQIFAITALIKKSWFKQPVVSSKIEFQTYEEEI